MQNWGILSLREDRLQSNSVIKFDDMQEFYEVLML